MIQTDGKETALTSPFDYVTDGKFLDRVLLFEDESLANLAGFNVRLRIPRQRP